MNIIETYSDPEDLKKKVIKEYVTFLKSQIKATKFSLEKKNWASDPTDDYHVTLRNDYRVIIEKMQDQIKALSNV